MANITPDDVRYAGGWSEAYISDIILSSDMYIPVGDAWLHEVIGGALSAVTDDEDNAILKAAEIYFVAHLVASRPQKEDFQTGPLKSSSPKAGDNQTSAKMLFDRAEYFLNKAGYSGEGSYTWSEQGGSDYRKSGDDNTNVDMSQSAQGFSFFGG